MLTSGCQEEKTKGGREGERDGGTEGWRDGGTEGGKEGERVETATWIKSNVLFAKEGMS